MTAELAGRRIIITGAATGIGLAAVREMSERGAQLGAIYHDSPPPPELASAARWHRCDLTDKEAVDTAFAALAGQLGGLDVLLHAAGLWAAATPEGVSEAELSTIMAVNLFTNQAAFAWMRQSGGAIVNLGSVEGVTGSPISSHYAMAKAAVHAWTRSAARAWAASAITVNAVAPCVDTPNAERLRDYFRATGADPEETVKARMKMLVPLGGAFGDAGRDLSPVLAFLCGPGARFITGQLIAVDGGMRMLGA
jgi:NAD(P)-dependent dehydrogenase (short-subunit alcohol dehydrogenase family)